MKTSVDITFSSTAKASSQASSTGSFTWSSRLYWLQPIHLGFAMMESLTLGSLIKKVSFPRFGWLVRWMQKGYDRNTVCVKTFNQYSQSFEFQIVKEEIPNITVLWKPANFVAWQRNGCCMINWISGVGVWKPGWTICLSEMPLTDHLIANMAILYILALWSRIYRNFSLRPTFSGGQIRWARRISN